MVGAFFAPVVSLLAASDPPLKLEPLINAALRQPNVTEPAETPLVSHIKQAYHRLHLTYARQDIIESHENTLRNLLSVAQANYALGKGQQEDILKTQVQISLMEMRLIQVQEERHTEDVAINALLCRPPASPLGRPVDPPPPVIRRSREELPARGEPSAASHPNKLEIAAVGKQAIFSDNPEKDAPIPLDTHKADERVTAPWAYRTDDEYAKAQSAAKILAILSTTILPQARMAAHSALVAYENGSAAFLDVVTSYTTVFEAEMKYQEEITNLLVAAARVEEMTGVDITR